MIIDANRLLHALNGKVLFLSEIRMFSPIDYGRFSRCARLIVLDVARLAAIPARSFGHFHRKVP
jgi:hypothetical protein